MKKMILKLSLISFMLLGNNLLASDDKIKEIVVTGKKITLAGDEANNDKPKIARIKGGEKDTIRDLNVSLTSIKDSYHVSRKDLNSPPYRCFIYNVNKTEDEVGISNESAIDFKIEKSSLNVGDTIVITNSIKNDSPFGKVIIEWVEILK